MLQLGAGLLICLVQLALYCWSADEWWKMFAFNGAVLMAAVLVNLFTSLSDVDRL